MSDSPLTQVRADNASHACAILSAARAQSIAASYHPAGGHAPGGYIPVTHTVWLECDAKTAAEIASAAREVKNAET